MDNKKRNDIVETSKDDAEEEDEFCVYNSPNQQHCEERCDKDVDESERGMSGLVEQTEEIRDQVDVVGLTEEGGPGEEDCDEELIQAEDSFVMGQCEDEQVQIENTASPEPSNDSTADERHSRPQRERGAPRLFTYGHLCTPTCYNTSCSGEVQRFTVDKHFHHGQAQRHFIILTNILHTNFKDRLWHNTG
ncbi:uncharacterized protein LOC107675601 [Tachysurus ichikawai]